MQAESTGRWVLRIAGFAGLCLFLFFFALTWHTPQWVEDFAADYLHGEVISQVETRIDAFQPPAGDSALARLAGELYRHNEEQIQRIRTELKQRARQQLTAALSAVRDPQCICRVTLSHWLEAGVNFRLAQLALDNEQVTAFIQASYLERIQQLKHEIRVFTAINASCFLLLLLLSFAKPAAGRHLLLPGMLLLFATLFCAFLYLTSQDWLLAIVHGDYVGWSYTAYLGLVVAFLADIAVKRGRVTASLVNAASSVFGGIVTSLSPC